MINRKSYHYILCTDGILHLCIWGFLFALTFRDVANTDGVALLLFSIIGTLWTVNYVYEYKNGKLTYIQESKFLKIRKSVILYSIILFSFLMFPNFEVKKENLDLMGFPLLFVIILIFNSSSIHNTLSSFSAKKSAPTQPPSPQSNWFMDKIVAPVIVGTILGFIGYAITGSFPVGGGITVLSIPITWAISN